MRKLPRLNACALALAIAGLPLIANAAGLGRLNVMSGLGQPFRGEIDLVAVQPSEADSLVVNLAPPETYAAAQISYPSSSLGLRFNIEKRASGQYYVLVTSAQMVSEPYLDLVVELNWAAGRIQREYTALIDPAGYTPSAGGNAAATGGNAARFAPSALPGVKTSGTIKGGKQKSPKASSAAPADGSASASGGAGDYRVKPGDTLFGVAKQVQPEGVSLEQVLVGLYKANPAAFDGNMNRLKRGKILKVPGSEELQQVNRSQAAKEIKVQSEDWRSYRGKLAENAVKSAPQEPEAQSGSGKLKAQVEDKGASAADKNKDVLKLSKPAVDGKKGSNDRVAALEEEVAARQKALDEANQRVSELSKNVAEMEKLAAKGRAASVGVTTTVAGSKEVASKVVGAASAEAVANASSASVAETSAVHEASTASQASRPARKRVVVPPPVPVEEPGVVDMLIDNSLYIGGGVLALLLGGVGVWYARRRKQSSSFEDSIITGSDLKANTVLGSTGGGVISTQSSENSFLTDFSRQGLGTIDTDEVDPIAEAEVYMAYGRDAQAEEILKEALKRDPGRNEIRAKLLDIYSARKDLVSFEEHASALYAATGGAGALWDDVARNGRSVDPANPLYKQAEKAAEKGVEKSTVPAAAVAVAGAAVVAAGALAAASASKDEDPITQPDLKSAALDDLDFDLDLDTSAAVTSESIVDEPVVESAEDLLADGGEMDFDLDLANSDFAPEPVPESVANSPVPTLDVEDALDVSFGDVDQPDVDDGLMSLDLPIDLGIATPSADSSVTANTVDHMPGLDVDLDVAAESMESLEADVPMDALSDPLAGLALPAAEDFDGGLSAIDAIAADPAIEDVALDFDFDLDEPDAATSIDPVATASVSAENPLGDLSLDLQAAGQELDFTADDPVQTKIDLAKAYIDMGDVEGAREILLEAIQEGNGEQKTHAQSLLDDL